MTLMTLPLRLAIGVFNLVCALHAAADGSEVESDRGMHGCLVTIGERFFILSGRHSPPGYTREKKSAGKASRKIRWTMPKIGWHVMITLHYSNGFPRRSRLSPKPAPATASLGRLQTQGNGEGRQGRMGWGHTYIL
jgi:hypothetical protein